MESKEEVIKLNRKRQQLKAQYPNLVQHEADLSFKHFYNVSPSPEPGTLVKDQDVTRSFFGIGPVRRKTIERPFEASPLEVLERRKKIRIGIPRALNVFTFAPFLRTWLEALGIDRRNVVFSDETSEELYREGGKYGSIDPCYPAKVAQAHIHNLLHKKQERRALDYVWFPAVTHMPSFTTHMTGSTCCPIVAGTPKVQEAAFTKEKNFFAKAGVTYVSDPVNFEMPRLLREQLFATWGERLDITRDENDRACLEGWQAMSLCDEELETRALTILTQAERDNDVVVLMIGRPYHSDPGLNHDILEDFQALGFPVLSMRSIPKDPDYLKHFFAEDIRSGRMSDVFDTRDVWPENYSANSVQKVWAAKFAARHPNVAVVDLSSFKCGNDAPTYGLIDKIISTSKTPWLAMHDLDANKAGGSIKIRVKTFTHTLKLYKEHLEDVSRQRMIGEHPAWQMEWSGIRAPTSENEPADQPLPLNASAD